MWAKGVNVKVSYNDNAGNHYIIDGEINTIYSSGVVAVDLKMPNGISTTERFWDRSGYTVDRSKHDKYRLITINNEADKCS